jgi:hypothetical protein
MGVKAVKPLVKGARGDGKVAAGEAGVLAVSAVEIHPCQASAGLAG